MAGGNVVPQCVFAPQWNNMCVIHETCDDLVSTKPAEGRRKWPKEAVKAIKKTAIEGQTELHYTF